MDIYRKIDKLCKDRGWTIYELCKRANIPQTTLSSSRKRNNDPSISTLEALCEGFGITMSQFFSESNVPLDLTDKQKELLEQWGYLSDKQKKAVYELIKNM
ncbi:MAG: helix-turn-helix transcriptional regulator [Eubacteriales bacterium]|nr:helix-turn-helix transcriptional regulator [Eubacteriales bacterium]